MNRSILIVICDFLLVSLLAFSTVDINKVSDEGTPRNMKMEIAPKQADAGKDVVAVMRLALDEERKNRDQLVGELSRTRATIGERERQMASIRQDLQSREQQVASIRQDLQSREQQVASIRQDLQSRDQRAQSLQQEQASLQREQASLQQRYAEAQTNLQGLARQLQGSTAEALMSKEKLEAMQAELRKQAEQSTALQNQMAQLAKSNQMVLAERQQLAQQLQVAEVEKRHATEQAARMQEEVKVERAEKAKLTEGFKTLASRSGQLAEEIRENRPLAPNTIFNQFVTNRVQVRLAAVRNGVLGTSRRKDAETVLVSTGTNIFALSHVQDTPFLLSAPGSQWDELTGTLAHNGASYPVPAVSFALQDPRLIYIPVSQAQANSMGAKVYRTASDPFKFQDAGTGWRARRLLR